MKHIIKNTSTQKIKKKPLTGMACPSYDRTVLDARIAKTKEKLLKALKKHHGLVYMSCESIGVIPNTYYDYMKKDEEFAKAVEAIKEGTIDIAENQLITNLQAGDTTANIFYLKCKAKHRGYIERQEIRTLGNGTDLPDLENQSVISAVQMVLDADRKSLADTAPLETEETK